MTRPVLLITIGADALPETTPVIPVFATWVPAIYVPPPVPVPTGVLSSAIADAVLLTWAAVDALAPEYEIERAPDDDGVPGAWARISKTLDLRFIAAAPDGLAYWFRLRTESLGRLSDYTAPVVGVPIASNPVVVPLAIVGGVVTINCAYQQFKLVLTAHVTSVVFVNVPAAATILIEIEQAGAFTIAWPASVSPISGVPFVVSATAGAVDLVGLTTNNTGVTWRLTAQQPVAGSGGGAGAPIVTIAPSPASATVATDGVTPAAPSVLVTASVAGGTAPITHAWTRADAAGGANFLFDNAAIAAPTFSIAAGTTAFPATLQQWRDTVTDAATLTGQAIVDITLTRTAPASVSLAPSPASAAAFSPFGGNNTASVVVTATRTGMIGPLTQNWVKLAGDGGIALSFSAGGSAATFQHTASQNSSASATYRHTTTDTGNGGATYTADVTVTLEIVDDR